MSLQSEPLRDSGDGAHVRKLPQSSAGASAQEGFFSRGERRAPLPLWSEDSHGDTSTRRNSKQHPVGSNLVQNQVVPARHFVLDASLVALVIPQDAVLDRLYRELRVAASAALDVLNVVPLSPELSVGAGSVVNGNEGGVVEPAVDDASGAPVAVGMEASLKSSNWTGNAQSTPQSEDDSDEAEDNEAEDSFDYEAALSLRESPAEDHDEQEARGIDTVVKMEKDSRSRSMPLVVEGGSQEVAISVQPKRVGGVNLVLSSLAAAALNSNAQTLRQANAKLQADASDQHRGDMKYPTARFGGADDISGTEPGPASPPPAKSRFLTIEDTERTVLEDQETAHCRDPLCAADVAGISDFVICSTTDQDATMITPEGRVHREIAVRCREAQRVAGRAEYTYMDLVGSTHGYHGQTAVEPVSKIFDLARSSTHERSIVGSPSFSTYEVPVASAFPLLGLHYQSGTLRTNCVDCLDR
jgi:hypothetical protein